MLSAPQRKLGLMLTIKF